MKNNTQKESYSNLVEECTEGIALENLVKECMKEMTLDDLEILSQFALHLAKPKSKLIKIADNLTNV